jgi:acyl-CoA thioesterase
MFDLTHVVSTPDTATATVELQPQWVQGKGVYGGMLTSMMMATIDCLVDAQRKPLRTITVHFCAPAKPGSATILVEVVRAGILVRHLRLTMTNRDGVVAMGTATAAAARIDVPIAASFQHHPMPVVMAYDDCAVVDVDLPIMPTFARNFAYRFCGGDLPYSGGAHAHALAWLELRSAREITSLQVPVWLDALPPALLSRLDGPRAAATVDWTVTLFPEVHTASAVGAVGLVEVHSRQAGQGYAEEQDRLWSRDGRLLGIARQLYAVL